MGFGFFYLLWLSLGLIGAYLLFYPFSEKLGKNDKSKWIQFTFGILFALMLIAIGFITGEYMTMVAPVISGIFFLTSTSLWDPKPKDCSEDELQERARFRVIFVIISLLIPILLAAIPAKLLVNSSIKNLGIRKNNVSLILSKENYIIIENLAKELNIPLFGCSTDADKGSVIVHNIDVLWHGIGERSLVEIPLPILDKRNTVARVELDSKGVKILELMNPSSNQPNTIKSCINLSADTLFDTYSSTPNQLGTKRLVELKKKISTYTKGAELKIDSVSITGHTDQAPVLKGGDSNIGLSKRRAEAVAVSLTDLFTNLSKDKIQVNGNGAMTPKSNCSEELSRLELNECRAIDRRVELEFFFSKQ
jgi:outer membrane protein OmpA-like peptidoglycan-associated protein